MAPGNAAPIAGGIMGFSVNTNVANMRAQLGLSRANSELGGVYERISTGRRINSAKDDAAGLAMSEKLDAESRSARAAERNVQHGQGMI